MKKLSILRWVFVAYIIAKTVVDMVAGSFIGHDLSKIIYTFGTFSLANNPFAYIVLVLIIDLVILLGIGLLFFRALLDRKNWARILFLVIAWLTVIDVLSGLLFVPQVTAMLNRISPGTDWERLLLFDRITDLLALAYAVFVIWLLQFDRSVKQLFLPEPGTDPVDPK
jgi:hypothetical protein